MSVTIRDVMTDAQLFGHTFGGDSFAAWRELLGGFYGLSLSDAEAEVFRTLTGRRETPAEAHDELWLVVGRRGGKSHVAALVAVFEAAFKDHRDKLAVGEWATVLLIAADRPQARTLLRYVRGMFEHPMLKPLVLRETAEGLELRNRCPFGYLQRVSISPESRHRRHDPASAHISETRRNRERVFCWHRRRSPNLDESRFTASQRRTQ